MRVDSMLDHERPEERPRRGELAGEGRDLVWLEGDRVRPRPDRARAAGRGEAVGRGDDRAAAAGSDERRLEDDAVGRGDPHVGPVERAQVELAGGVAVTDGEV